MLGCSVARFAAIKYRIMKIIPEKVDEASLKAATKKMALEAIKLVEALPKTKTADVLGKQLLRSATSVAANYRAACRAKSDLDMLSKLGIVEEEADESCLHIELLVESGTCKDKRADYLHPEFSRMTAIVVASRRTLRKNVEKRGNIAR
jgi:four helix bundle protein